MGATSLTGLLSYLRRLSSDEPADTEDDSRLLVRFLQGDGAAFTALVERHAPLVWGVCRRVLGTSPDAEDAFQATFVVLVQKASSLADGRPLAPWLYRVASRTATKAQVRAARRRSREVAVEIDPASAAPPDLERCEIRAVLDEELARLSERYRQPVILCYLEGLTNEEAARRLACPRGTILSRLSRARRQLRERLARRGLDLTDGALPGLLAAPPTPPTLVEAVRNAGPALRAGGAAGLSSSAMILAKGVMIGMFLRKLEVVGVVLLLLMLAASGFGVLTRGSRSSEAQAASGPDARAVGTGKEDKAKAPPPAAKEDKREEARIENREREFCATLRQAIDFPGWDDPKTTFVEALDQLARLSRLTFDVNDKAFQAEKVEQILKSEICNPNPVPPMKTSLRTVLNKTLARLPVEAVYLVRKDVIEITTLKAARAELRLPDTEPFILVHANFRGVSLPEALGHLADDLGANIVLDARVARKNDPTIDARLMNAPLDTAVKVLTDMAGLGVVRLENVLYVTSTENADRLRKESAKKPTPAEPRKSDPK